MIIKIDIDDGVNENDALMVSNLLITVNKDNSLANKRYYKDIVSKITHISKSGNIFIHVSKVDEKIPAKHHSGLMEDVVD